MKIYSGSGTTEFGPGVQIDLKGNEIARGKEVSGRKRCAKTIKIK